MAAEERSPLWAWVLVGALLGLAAREIPAPELPPRVADWERDREEELDPDRMSPRALRRLPGVGERRALAFARARWEHRAEDGPLRWSDVHGVGPATEAGIGAWLAARGVDGRWLEGGSGE